MNENKQIEEMGLAICKSRGVSNGEGCEGCCQDSLCLYQQIAMSLYGAGYRKQEWISVEERLPELEGKARTWGKLQIQPSVRVLCTCVQKSGKVLVKEGFYELWGDRVVWKIPGSIDSVTHWMPLPEPLKGE